MSDLAENIAGIFKDLKLTWKIDGQQTIPNAEDVQAVLDHARFEVEYQAVNSHLEDTSPQIEMRHLLFNQSENGRVQVFVHIGEIE